jgi:hypothetical protein
VEGGEQLQLLDEDLHMIEPLVQTLKNVKNEVTISDGLIQDTKIVGHALYLVTVVADAEVTLLEGRVAERVTHGCRAVSVGS